MLTSGQATTYNLAGGLIAGMAAAVISQPADTLLSKINKTKGAPGQSTTSRLVQMAGQLGAKGLFTGMSARLVMIGTLTAGQCEFFSPVLGLIFGFWVFGSWSCLESQIWSFIRAYRVGIRAVRGSVDCSSQRLQGDRKWLHRDELSRFSLR
jgi:hypothetical protein